MEKDFFAEERNNFHPNDLNLYREKYYDKTILLNQPYQQQNDMYSGDTFGQMMQLTFRFTDEFEMELQKSWQFHTTH
ncbi:MAG: hypothetical protein M0P32_10045 [Bacteroidales bacterium]|jgi:hypothetical protein|nr:hypothetical protein [Bacteroidales bacterium]